MPDDPTNDESHNDESTPEAKDDASPRDDAGPKAKAEAHAEVEAETRANEEGAEDAPALLRDAADDAGEGAAASIVDRAVAHEPAIDAANEAELDEPMVEEPTTGARRWLPVALAAGVAVVFFFLLPPLTRSGLWDPYELNVADLARRVAINLHGATNLVLSGADNSLPHLNDLGRPQLPFTAVALGFKTFGLHEWAGRAPLALFGLLGVLATYAFVARLFDRKAALYSAVALTTMPLYFVQARSILGDVCTMSGFAMAFGGFAVAVFDRDDDGPTRAVKRLPWIALGIVGLLVGYGSRGALLGVGVPAFTVGAAWALTWAAGSRKADAPGDAVGGLALAVGLVALVAGAAPFFADSPPKDLSMAVGAMLRAEPKYPTFDFYLASMGHSMAPWSAFLPFAMGRIFTAPVGRRGAVYDRESFARMAILVGLAVAFVAHGFMAARTDLIAFTAPALAAAACGVAIRELERGAHASIAVGVGTAILLAVFHHDFHELPEKAYQAFAVTGASFPESFKAPSLTLWWIVLGGFALVAFLTWLERDSDREPFDPKTFASVFKGLRDEWDGLLALGFFAVVAGASLAGLFVWVGVRTHAKWLPQMSLQIRDSVLNGWWVVAFVPLGAIAGIVFARDLWLWAFNRSRPFGKASVTRGFEPFEALLQHLRDDKGPERAAAALILFPFMVLLVPAATLFMLTSHGTKLLPSLALAIPSGVVVFLVLGMVGDLVRHRAAALALGGVVVGAVLCASFYPALANQLSPKEVFESYQRVHKGCEPLALLGVGGRTAAYYAGGQPMTFSDPQAAYEWLQAPDSCGRRFLALKAEELPKLNQLYRERSEPRANLPVLDARSSQILLAASSLDSGEKNDNPLNKVILSAPPHPQRKLDVNMEDKLQVLGIDIVDSSGKPAEVVAPGRKYHFRTYYRVLDAVGTEWQAFIHVDGYRRRHNGDHKPMGGKYPMSLWLKGDLLVDDFDDFALEPNFTPGAYTIYFGLFVGDTRLKVKSGPSDGDNRVNGGQLRVQ